MSALELYYCPRYSTCTMEQGESNEPEEVPLELPESQIELLDTIPVPSPGQDEAPVQPVDGDSCTLPKDRGTCKAGHQKYYFDVQTLICSLFLYGGCGGNANRYDTKEECEQKCRAHLQPAAICKLPLNV
uniref:BPTI/Kunitz inhibitor domain-containing protein n=1 Tax=Trichuris muris TaxID=70415 RepID=A0A5S6QM24_TRIMR